MEIVTVRERQAEGSTARPEIVVNQDSVIARRSAFPSFSFSPCLSWVTHQPHILHLTVPTVSVGRAKTVETVQETKSGQLSTQLKQGENENEPQREKHRKLRHQRAFCFLLFASCTLFITGCRRDMQDQPKAKPYRASGFFKDGLSSRPPVEGTVPRGWLREDTEFFTGKKSKTPGPGTNASKSTQSGPLATTPAANASASQVAAAYPDDTEKFPFPITEQLLNRGQERFNIFCSVCHGMTGEADGMIVRRGFRKPPSYHDPRLLAAPVGHFFDVVTNGWGAMPSYASQVPVQDRWAIIAYIRALQLTRQTQSAPAPAAKPAATPTPKAPGGQK